MKKNEILHKQIIGIVENQLRANKPPITKQTYQRLLDEGISRENAKKYIGQCVAVEIFHVFKSQEPFNEERFTKNLKNLPQAPSD
jgi:hypothetical protein